MIHRLLWMAVGAIVALWGRRRASVAVDSYIPVAARAHMGPAQTLMRRHVRNSSLWLREELQFALRSYLEAKRYQRHASKSVKLGLVRDPESMMPSKAKSSVIA